MAPHVATLPRHLVPSPAPSTFSVITIVAVVLAVVATVILVLSTSEDGSGSARQLAREYTALTGEPVGSGWYDPDLMSREDQMGAVAEARRKADARALRSTSKVLVTPAVAKRGEITFKPVSLTGYRAEVNYELGIEIPRGMPLPAASFRVADGAPAVVMPGNGIVDVMFPVPVEADRIRVETTTGTVAVEKLTLYVAG